MQNPYDVLEIDKTASKEEIKKAYKKKAKKTHPDAGGSEEEFKQVNQAYMILYDDNERAYYDKHGKAKENTPKSTLMDEACSSLIKDFRDILLNQSVLHSAILPKLKNEIDFALSRMSKGIKEAKAAQKTANKVYAKFKFNDKKSKSCNLLKIAYDTKITEIRHDILQMITSRRIILRKSWLLDCYIEEQTKFEKVRGKLYE
jgi:DnaJ-class molecular chaperone